MKLVGHILLALFAFSSIASAQNAAYIRKTQAGAGVSTQEATQVKDFVTKAAADVTQTPVVKNFAEAKFSLKGVIDKAEGGFVLKVEKQGGGKTSTSEAVTVKDATEFEATIKQLVTSVISADGQLPEKKVSANTGDMNQIPNYYTAGRGPSETPAAESTASSSTPPNRWYVGIGPAWSQGILNGVAPSVLGGNINEGTKFGIELGMIQPLSEVWDLKYYYSGTFNTSTMGTTPVTAFGAGFNYYTQDRNTDTSPILGVNLGYGGANRNSNASLIGGGTLGVQFFRTQKFQFEAVYSLQCLLTREVTNSPNYPIYHLVRFGVYFQ